MREVKTLFVADAEDGVRLDRWFRRRWPHVSHVQLNKLLRTGQIRVDGARAEVSTRLSGGSQVHIPPLVFRMTLAVTAALDFLKGAPATAGVSHGGNGRSSPETERVAAGVGTQAK